MRREKDSGVSPVIGVMLMLVVVIIIAAVVSGFAGGLMGNNNQKVPQLSLDTHIVNGGYWTNSYFMMTVTGVDNPIPTKELKIVTSWSKTLSNGTTITDGKTTVPGMYNYHMYYMVQRNTYPDDWYATVPLGYGPGVVDSNGKLANANFWPFEINDTAGCKVSGQCQFEDVDGVHLGNVSWFGNYVLKSGTIMLARPFGGHYGNSRSQDSNSGFLCAYGRTNTTGYTTGGGKFKYAYGYDIVPHSGTNPGGETARLYPTIGLTPGSESEDMMMGLLGAKWNYLMPGDTVNVRIIHSPSGKTIYNKDVAVEG
jgi:archaeal type IV pilus assembly protein PilA